MDEIVVIDLFGEEFRFQPDSQVENSEQIVQYLKNYIKITYKIDYVKHFFW